MSFVVGSFYAYIDDSLVEKACMLFGEYLKLLGFRQRGNSYVLRDVVHVRVCKEGRSKDDRYKLKVFVTIPFNLSCKCSVELSDFTNVDVSDDDILIVPTITHNYFKLELQDILFPDEVSKLSYEGRLVELPIVMEKFDYKSVNVLIIFSALLVCFYFSFIRLLKDAYNKVSKNLRGFTAIVTHNRYVMLKEITQDFDRWRGKLDKLVKILRLYVLSHNGFLRFKVL